MTDDLRLSEAEILKARAWLEQKGAKKCRICASSQYSVADTLVMLPVTPSVSGYAAVVVACNDCGHLELYHAGVVGIIEGQVFHQPKK